jgi:glycosyltransferase involved in cell wall biosynthesis
MLSVVIITKNEELNIRRCLESVQWADEIIVLDSGSTDKTIAIAKEFTPHVFSTNWQGFGVQKQRALAYATCPWVLNLDADESVSPQLRSAIEKAISLDKYDAYRIPIKLNFYGQTLNFTSSPTRHIRLFKREGANYSDDLVHEKIILPQTHQIGRLSAPIMHHSLRDIQHAIYKMNLYSSYSAKIKLQKQNYGSIWKAILGSGWMFVRCYFLQGGLFDGRAGLILSIMNAHSSFYRSVKQFYPDLVEKQL